MLASVIVVTIGCGTSASNKAAVSNTTVSQSSAGSPTPSTASTAVQVDAPTLSTELQSAQSIASVPSDLTPSLTDSTDTAKAGAPYTCHSIPANPAGVPSYAFGGCFYGDTSSTKTMVVYGDSHAGMWAAALEAIAERTGYRLATFMLPGCPPVDLSFISFQTGSKNKQCDAFHQSAPAAIRALHPAMVFVTGESSEQRERGSYYDSSSWQGGMVSTLQAMTAPGTRVYLISNIPQWTNDDANCLAAHEHNVSACMVPVASAVQRNVDAERAAAGQVSGVTYIDTQPWICAAKCVPIVGHYRVFLDPYHLTKTYAVYLSGVLQAQIGI